MSIVTVGVVFLLAVSIILFAKQVWKRTMNAYLILALVFIIILLTMISLSIFKIAPNTNYDNFSLFVYYSAFWGIVLCGIIGAIKPDNVTTGGSGFSGGKLFVIIVVALLVTFLLFGWMISTGFSHG